jgi:hypothetical protein
MAGTIDVRATLTEFDEILRKGTDPDRVRDVLAVLWRWQRDPDLDDPSRDLSRQLLNQYGRNYPADR